MYCLPKKAFSLTHGGSRLGTPALQMYLKVSPVFLERSAVALLLSPKQEVNLSIVQEPLLFDTGFGLGGISLYGYSG